MFTLAPSITHPFLSDRWAPVHDEIDVADLGVEGTLADDLTGADLCHGLDPEFPPLGSQS